MPSISPENWKYISFGKDIDIYGGKASPLKENNIVPHFTEADTSRGRVMTRYSGEKFNIVATDLGIGLLYDKDGALETVGLDLFQYLNNIDSGDLSEVGEDGVYLFVEKMVANGDHLYFSLELKDKTVAVANINEETGEKSVLYSSDGIDISKRTMMVFNYDGFTIFLGMVVDEDELELGVITKEGENLSYDNQFNLLVTTILSDCNLKTFLENKSEDKYDKLAKRIFIA